MRKIYLASGYSVMKSKNLEMKHAIKFGSYYRRLVSFFDKSRDNKIHRAMGMNDTMKKTHEVDLFLDSGGYSAFSQGAEINIQEYITFIKEHEDILEVYANLDVIGDPKGTWKNQKIMERAGLKPLPIFHYGSNETWLLRYLNEGYEYLALGGMVPISTPALKPWLDRIFSQYICDDSGMPKVKVHGFGLTSLRLMLEYPWFCMTEEEHQVLTKQGWKYRNELTIGEEVLCFDKGESKWEGIQGIPCFEVKDEEMIHLSNRNFSATVTYNHKWVVTNQNKKGEKWSFRSTLDLKQGDCIPRVGNYIFPTEQKYTDEQVELAAWFWTDGSIKKREKYKKDSVVIYQSMKGNPKKCVRIEKAIKNSGEPHYAGKDHYELYGEMRDFLLENFPEKKLNLDFVLNLTETQLHLFVKCSVLADGTTTQLVRKKGFAIAVTRQIKKDNLDIMRIACLLLGIPTSIYHSKETKGLNSSSVDWIYKAQVKQTLVKYTGNIWCIQVPSKAFYVKSNDKIYVTGNSVDSTSWVMTGRMGKVYVPRIRAGKYIYGEDSWKISVSSRSPGLADDSDHIKNLSPKQQETILDYIHSKGYKLGKSSFKTESQEYVLLENEKWAEKKPKDKGASRQVEILEEEGISNKYQLRDELNIIYFLDLEKSMPEWPWAFKLKGQGGGLGLL